MCQFTPQIVLHILCYTVSFDVKVTTSSSDLWDDYVKSLHYAIFDHSEVDMRLCVGQDAHKAFVLYIYIPPSMTPTCTCMHACMI